VIAYATQPNQVAADGGGHNSPFTAALLKEIKEPGLEIATFFRRVAVDVDRATFGKQFPELSISMTGEFYLNTHESDTQAWMRVRQSSDPVELQDFVRRYPQSFLVADARARLGTLERERAAQAVAEREGREQVEKDRLEHERAERDKAERDRIARDEAERVKVEAPTAMLTPGADPPKAAASQVTPLSGGSLIVEIKKELKRVGCYTGRMDDKWVTADTKASVQKFVKHANFASSADEPTQRLLDAVRTEPDRVCPLECGAREVARNGGCVAKSCPNGLLLGSDGVCEPQKSGTKTAKIPSETDSANARPQMRGNKLASRSSETIPSEPLSINMRPGRATDTCTGLRDRCFVNTTTGGRPTTPCYAGYSKCMATGNWRTRAWYIPGVARR
jgi:Caspase domain